MSYTVSTFYNDGEQNRHAWTESFTIAVSEFAGYGATAREVIEGLLDGGQPDGSHPLGLEITDPTGKLVFTYVRPAPSQE